jgi:hypothetical protein
VKDNPEVLGQFPGKLEILVGLRASQSVMEMGGMQDQTQFR